MTEEHHWWIRECAMQDSPERNPSMIFFHLTLNNPAKYQPSLFEHVQVARPRSKWSQNVLQELPELQCPMGYGKLKEGHRNFSIFPFLLPHFNRIQISRNKHTLICLFNFTAKFKKKRNELNSVKYFTQEILGNDSKCFLNTRHSALPQMSFFSFVVVGYIPYMAVVLSGQEI